MICNLYYQYSWLIHSLPLSYESSITILFLFCKLDSPNYVIHTPYTYELRSNVTRGLQYIKHEGRIKIEKYLREDIWFEYVRYMAG